MRSSLILLPILLAAGCQNKGGSADAADAAATANNSPNTEQATSAFTSPDLESITAEMAKLTKARSTPDTTVESFIKLLNLRHKADCYYKSSEFSRDNSVKFTEIENDKKTYYTFMSGNMLEGLLDDIEPRQSLKTCLEQAYVYSVMVRDVTIQSQTRALVIAHLTNVTPIPAGADSSDKSDLARREAGETVRYVLSKADDGWTISNYEDNGSTGWEPWFKGKEVRQPQVPWMTGAFY